MRYFVTGASGFIGSAAVGELIGVGHQVLGLARSESSAQALLSAGAEVLRSDLDELDELAAAAASSDGVAHLAFKHDIAFTGGFAEAAAADRSAIEALGTALAGSGKPLVIASGLAGLAPGRTATESDRADEAASPRVASETSALALTERGVRAVSLRFAPTVHGQGDHGFMHAVIAAARAQGVAAHVGDGSQRWPALHRSDAAVLVRLALEQAPSGSVLHGSAEEGVALRAVAEVIGRHLDLPVVSIDPSEAADHFGFLAHFLSTDMTASSAATRQLLDWHPSGPGLVADLDAGHYFGTG